MIHVLVRAMIGECMCVRTCAFVVCACACVFMRVRLCGCAHVRGQNKSEGWL